MVQKVGKLIASINQNFKQKNDAYKQLKSRAKPNGSLEK